MIRAILADDEPVIVKGLTRLIDWKQKGIKIVGTAADGIEALELVRSKKPDLLISDINMPGLTGIELLKIINSELLEVRVIFISGFHEFEYAHSALKYGALDYLLKPISEAQLDSALSKAFKVSKKAAVNVPSETSEESVPQLPDWGPGFYSVIQISIDSEDFTGSTEGEQNIIYFSAVNLISDYLAGKEVQNWILERDNSLYLIFFCSHRERLAAIVERHVKQIIKMIQETLRQRLIAAEGKTVDSHDDLEEAFLSSRNTMQNRFFYTEGDFLRYKNSMNRRYSHDDLYTRQIRMIESVMKYDDKRIIEATDSYLNVLKDVTYGNKDATISFCLGSLVSLKKQMETEEVCLNILDFNDHALLNELNKLHSYKNFIQWFQFFINKISLEYQSFRESQTHPEIDKIKKYIESHYAENIRLQDLADLVYLHPNYISGHFKKYTGQNFKDYLTDVRMAEAEKLLTSSDLKVYEIAEHVGFSDYRHFSEVFKKKFTVSPGKFKN